MTRGMLTNVTDGPLCRLSRVAGPCLWTPTGRVTVPPAGPDAVAPIAARSTPRLPDTLTATSWELFDGSMSACFVCAAAAFVGAAAGDSAGGIGPRRVPALHGGA